MHHITHYRFKVVSLVILLIAACTSTPLLPEVNELPQPINLVQKYTPTASITPTALPTPTASPTPLVTATPIPSPTSTPDPYLELSMQSLTERTYGGGVLQDAGRLYAQGNFSRRQFKYRSEGLDLYGFMNIPDGEGPFAVIIMLHGFVEPGFYKTVAYSARYADALVEYGFIVIHPNLRRYAPSEDGPNQLGIGDTIDTLNLINLVRRQAGTEGLLKKADAERIALWGHSMGGGIVMRALILDDQLRGGLLYASINSNERINLRHFEDDGRGISKLIAPADVLETISPAGYLDEIDVPISIHHGSADAVVPSEWSEDLCETLLDLQKEVDCIIYPEQTHTFQNEADSRFIENSAIFFKRVLK